MTQSLTIIIPAFNEEGNIESACRDVNDVAQKYLSEYEILVVDDASWDRTTEIVTNLQKEIPRLVLLRNPVNRGLGYNYRRCLTEARFPYAMMYPGDNEMDAPSLGPIFQKIGTTDIIVTYCANTELRSSQRRFVSKLFTQSINFLFGLNVPYYNGPCIVRTDLARKFLPATSSFAYMAIILVRSIRSGASYQTMPFLLIARGHGKTKAFRLNNVVSVIKDVLTLFWNEIIWKQRVLTPLKKECLMSNHHKNEVIE